tara:strand:- start:92 stop:1015 length:924 start_codon:yes stop_codon:yes gene_type:complete
MNSIKLFFNSLSKYGIKDTCNKLLNHLIKYWLDSSTRFIFFFYFNPFKKTSIKTKEYKNINQILLKNQLIETGQEVLDYNIDKDEFVNFYNSNLNIFEDVKYQYYSSPSKQKKIIEYFLSFKFSNLKTDSIILDVASHRSVFPNICSEKKIKVYKQDLYYKEDLNSRILGGNAANISMPDSTFTNIFLHDSIQHFDNNDDSNFIAEACRLLKPNGKLFLAPIYLYPNDVIFIDPKFSKVQTNFKNDYELIYLKNYNNKFGRNFNPSSFYHRFIKPFRNFDVKIYHIKNSIDFDSLGLINFFGIWTKK